MLQIKNLLPALIVAAMTSALTFAEPEERLGDEDGETARAALSTEERVAELESMFTELSRKFTDLSAKYEALLASTSVTPSDPEQFTAASVTVGGEEARLLPSRSWAGGSYGSENFRIETHGFVDLEYIDAQEDGARGGVSTFDNHHANVFFDAKLRDNLRGHFEIEYEHGGDVTHVDQAFVSWETSDWLTLDLGRFYTPFGIERFTWYSPTNQLVSRPTVARQIVPGSFYATGIKASGIVHQNDQPRFTYEFALSDGLGDEAVTDRRGSRQTRDNNSSRAYSGRAAFVSWPRWEIGTSFHTQTYDDAGQLNLRFLGLDFSSRWKGFEFRGEYVRALVERAVDGLSTPDLEQDGWYAQLGYTFHWDRDLFPALTLATRYDRVDLDRAVVGTNDQRSWALAANFNLYQHFRMKTEYQFAREKGLVLNNDTFFTQFVFDF